MSPRRAVQRSPAVWTPADWADPAEWTIELAADERDEIVVATERAVAAGRSIDDLGIDDFPLPTISARAVEWSAEIPLEAAD